jgi:hypothetical protein
MYKKLPKIVRDAVDDKIHWLKTYLVMADEYNFDPESKQDAKRKLYKLEKFKNASIVQR